MWLKSPPKTDERGTIPLLRAQPGGCVAATLTGEPLRCFVHFAAGRSWPCTGHDCVLCAKNISKRCYAYYPVSGREGGQAILELTAQVEASLIQQMSPTTQVPCGHVVLKRAAGRRNMPCSIKWRGTDKLLLTASLPLTQNELKAALMRIWNLPTQNKTMKENEYLNLLNDMIDARTNNRKT